MRFYLLLALMLTSTAHAATPYTNNLTGPSVFYATDKEACEQMIPDAKAAFDSSNTRGWTINYTYSYREWAGFCKFSYVRSDGHRGTSAATLSTGKSAQALSGQDCKVDEESTYTWPLGRLDSSAEFNIAPGTQIPPPANACIDGCKARHSGVSSCFNSSQEQGSITYCDYNAKLTGDTCNTSDSPPPEVPQPTDPGDGGTDPGDGGTDPGDGGTDPGNGSNPGDGSTNPGNGGTTPGDGSTNPGDGNTNPGGGGTTPGNGGINPGTGDGTGDGGNASGLECKKALACTGDAVQCAILRLNKEQLCQWHYDSEVQDAVDAIMSGPEYQLEERSIPVDTLFTDALNKGRWLPVTCPPPEVFTVMGRVYSLSWEPVCRFAHAIGPILVALASIFFAVTIARGLKGS